MKIIIKMYGEAIELKGDLNPFPLYFGDLEDCFKMIRKHYIRLSFLYENELKRTPEGFFEKYYEYDKNFSNLFKALTSKIKGDFSLKKGITLIDKKSPLYLRVRQEKEEELKDIKKEEKVNSLFSIGKIFFEVGSLNWIVKIAKTSNLTSFENFYFNQPHYALSLIVENWKRNDERKKELIEITGKISERESYWKRRIEETFSKGRK